MDALHGLNGEAGHPSTLYERLEAYPFVTDPEFKLGLAALLGQPGTPVADDEVNRTDDLVLQAKCFYFSKKYDIDPYISLDGYKMWKQQQQSSAAPAAGEETASNGVNGHAAPNNNTNTTNASEAGAPAYPSSFARVVELITTGQPIPGIQEIPDTVLTGHQGPATAKQRPKPWEMEDGDHEFMHTNGTGEASDGPDSKSEGQDDDDDAETGNQNDGGGMPITDAAATGSSS